MYSGNSDSSLYSPLLDLSYPTQDMFTRQENANPFFLGYYEWLELENGNDRVQISSVRPNTGEEAANRQGMSTVVMGPDRRDQLAHRLAVQDGHAAGDQQRADGLLEVQPQEQCDGAESGLVPG